jgi:pSer/pThr/pTyr-binding forkhead associated (FHA) protein
VGTQRAEELERAADSRPPSENSRAAESGIRARTRLVPVMRQGQREFRLDRAVLTIGRSATCDIQVRSGLVSRRHARLLVGPLGVTVEDLGSRNGVYVNSARADGPVLLRLGDRIAVGDELMILGDVEESVDAAGFDPTLAAIPAQRTRLESVPEDDGSVATRNADVFQLIAGVVDKALAMGRGEEAERLIAKHLESGLFEARAGRHLPPDIARTAAGYAVKLAGATGKTAWLDHAVKLYAALDLVLPLALVDEMYVLLRRVRGMDLVALRTYTDALRVRMGELTPAERFVLQRLLGLERLAAWQSGASR